MDSNMYENFSQNDNLSIKSQRNDNLSFGSAQKSLNGCPCKKPISQIENNNPIIDELLIDSIVNANGINNGLPISSGPDLISSKQLLPGSPRLPTKPIPIRENTASNKDVLKYLAMLKKQKMEGNLKLNSGSEPFDMTNTQVKPTFHKKNQKDTFGMAYPFEFDGPLPPPEEYLTLSQVQKMYGNKNIPQSISNNRENYKNTSPNNQDYISKTTIEETISDNYIPPYLNPQINANDYMLNALRYQNNLYNAHNYQNQNRGNEYFDNSSSNDWYFIALIIVFFIVLYIISKKPVAVTSFTVEDLGSIKF